MPRLNRKLTEKEIINAKRKEKPYRLYDDGGLTILVRPKGAMVWQYRYRLNGKSNIYTIGEVGQIASSDARARRDEAKKLLDQGVDPNLARSEAVKEARWEASHTFEQLAREWYAKQTWAPKHAKNILSRLEKDVFNQIGRKPIKSVSVRDILDVLQKIESRGALDVAKRINQYCVAVFDYAISKGVCDNNPALGRAKFVRTYERKNRAHLKEHQLPSFLEALENYPNIKMKLFTRLLLLTFLRPGELRYTCWSYVDFDNSVINLPYIGMKTKKEGHIIPLSRQAVEALRALREITGQDLFLMPGRNPTKPISDGLWFIG